MSNLGAFGVVRTRGIPAWFIRKVTRSTVNHAVIYVGGGQVIEARPRGAGYRPAGYYPGTIWSTMPLTAVQQRAIVAAAERLVGTKYSWLDCAAIGIAKLTGERIPFVIRRRLSRPDRLMCSQLVDEVYRQAGIELFPDGRWPGDVSPQDLLAVIEAQR